MFHIINFIRDIDKTAFCEDMLYYIFSSPRTVSKSKTTPPRQRAVAAVFFCPSYTELFIEISLKPV